MAEISNRTSTSKVLSATKEGDTSNTNHEFSTNANDGDGNKALMSKPLLRLKVLNILRHENVFQQLVDLIKQQKAQITKKQESLQPDQEKTTANTDNKEEDTESLDEDESPSSDAFDVLHLLLHYAVQVSPLQMIKDIVNNFVINENNKLLKLDINYQDADGNTALHLAAYQSRSDVVQFLMSQTPYINDCVLNNRHLQPIEMCKDMNTASIMQNLRAKYITEIATEFRLAFNNRDFGHLETILENPRNFELLDINGTDPTTGDTVLHEFVKKKDIVMVRWILNHGGDPFKRDKNGKLPIDLVNYNKMSTNQTSTSEAPSKSTTSSDIPRSSATNVALNQELKKVLQQAARDQSVIDITNNLHEPPTFKGYLRKWTNFAQGYKLRWFVLDSEGTLSYYKDQDDTSNACRGSLNMSNCYLHLDSSEKLKFEIVGGSAGSIRWHLKGNHPVETNRWVWAIQGAIRYAKDRDMALKQGPSNKTTSTQSTTAQPNSNNASGLQKQQQRVLSNTSALHSAGAKQASPNASFTPLSKATTTTAAAGPASYKLSVGTASAAASGSNANDGNGHSKGSSVATSPQNNANEFYKSHRRTNTQNSIQSGLNENLTEDGKQYVEKLKSLDDDGRRSVISQESFSTSGAHSQMHLSNKQKNRLPSINFSESAANSSDEGEDEDKDYDDDEEEGDDALETRILEENFYSDNGKHNSKFFTNVGPYAAKISMLERSIAIELTSLNDLFVAGGFEHDESVVDAAQKSLKTMSESFKHLRRIQVKRDKKLIKMLLKQKEINNLWIKSVKDLEIELMQKQDKLGALAGEKKKLVKLLHKSKTDASCNDKMKEEIMQWQKNSIDDSDEDDDEFFDAEDVQSAPEEESEEELDHQPAAPVAAAAASADANVTANGEAQDDTKVDYGSKVESEKTTLRETPSTLEQRSTMTSTLANNTSATDKTKAPENEKASTKISEKSTVAAPKLDVPVPSFVATPKLTNPPQTKKFEQLIGEGTFAGYEDGIRKKLSLSKDDRPSVSLWSVLKSMVGKDMTKMTLPVSFNEPTSLLQRVAEDMEYDNLLEKAANASQDSTLRLLYVSVFAASAYASTQLRVAKPFNPLLGETFEYARPDRDYRFFTEQVSHHPPISAVWCESPKYDYYGESNVDSKFNGRSFDFKHLGLWYVKLRPDGEQSKKDETYTFHKPNNQVVGILIGNPQVDNYGDMEIKNHTTGDRCVLHFKARGWRSNHAYEVKGEVYNAKGGKEWVLGGHWNDDLYAKKVLQPNSNEEIKIDDKKSSSSSTSASEGADAKYDGSKFLIWKAAPRPDSPFNLTSFAITLNAPQPQLVPYLPRTDTRLRPDQRAMEDGKYDLAGDEKHRVEEKQRAVRKKREAGNIKYKPKWFVKKVHPVTKAQYWEFTGDYWKRRENHDLGDCPDIF